MGVIMQKDSTVHNPVRLSFLHKKDILRRFSLRARPKESEIRLRRIRAEDRLEIRELLQEAGNFTLQEIDVAASLVDEMLRGDSSYRFLVAVDEDDAVLGYVCYGQTPMTSGTWDVYWIVVRKRFQGKHIGSLLLQEVEREIGAERGRLILIETSTKPSYHPTRKFYQRMGYRVEARIAKFYSEKDDKLIFCKYLKAGGHS